LNAGTSGTSLDEPAFPNAKKREDDRSRSRAQQEVVMKNKLALVFAAAALAAGSAFALPAQAAPGGVKIGVLTCSESPGWGFVIGGSQRLNCRFTDTNGFSSFYTGHVSKLGLDIGHTRGGVITWAVFAPSSNMAPGALQGTYGGVSASISLGRGAGANLMIGGFDRAIQLQPLSVEGLRGDEVTAGLGSIDLKYVG
jgi:hypothetical protein